MKTVNQMPGGWQGRQRKTDHLAPLLGPSHWLIPKRGSRGKDGPKRKKGGAGKMGRPVWSFEGSISLPHILLHLNMRSPVDGPVGAGLGGVTLLEEVWRWGLVLRANRCAPLWFCPHCFWPAVQDVSSRLFSRCAQLPAVIVMDSYPSGSEAPNKPFLCLGHGDLSQQPRSN